MNGKALKLLRKIAERTDTSLKYLKEDWKTRTDAEKKLIRKNLTPFLGK